MGIRKLSVKEVTPYIQVNSDMPGRVGPGKLVRHMHMTDSVRHVQVCMLLHWGPHLIGIKVKQRKNMPGWTFIIHLFVCTRTTRRCKLSAAWPNKTRRLLDTCLSGIDNANYIINSIMCAVILVCGSRVPAYRIRPTHGPLHVLDMHGTGTKHIVRHSQKSGVQWSVISEFTCTRLTIRFL